MAIKEFLLIVAFATIVNHANALSCVKCDDKPCEVGYFGIVNLRLGRARE